MLSMVKKNPEKKKKMGRPPLENPKRVLVALRMTDQEKVELTRAAKKAGMSLSGYIMAPHRKKKRTRG